MDASPEQPELDAELDGQTEVVVRDRLERHNELLDVAFPSRVFRKSERPDALVGEELRPAKNDLPHLVFWRFSVGVDESRVAEQASDAVAERREASIERRSETSHINLTHLLFAIETRPF